MKTLTRIIAILLVILAGFNFSEVNGQSVINPADPVVTYSASAPPTQPVYGQIGKWVRTQRLNWTTTSFKSYIYKGSPFRIKFPKTYNHTAVDGKTYPMIIMFHGRGEAGTIYDNEYQLFHGGQTHRDAVDNGKFDGFVFFMQNQGGSWGNGHYQIISELIDSLVKSNKVDPFRVNVHGLSFGGEGAWRMTIDYPTYVASSLPMSNASIAFRNAAQTLKWIPMWVFQGGLDGNPAPATTVQVRDAILNVGGNFKYTNYPNLAHGTWNTAYAEADFFPFMVRAHKANPWPLFGRSEFCPGEAINITVGVSPGFDGYEWRKDGVIIPGATSNQINVTSIGTYDCRILRGTLWSVWSPVPLVVKTKGVTISPDIQITGLASKVLPALDGKTSVQLEVPEGYTSYNWQKVGNSTVLGTTRTLIASTPGDYHIRVTEQFGCSSNFSNAFSVVDADGPNKPDAPINLIISTLGKTSLKLDWSDNPAPIHNETNFEIYQASQAGGPYKFIALKGANVLTHTVTGLNPGVRYFYKLRAINTTGASAPSNEADGITSADITAPNAPTNLVISGTTRTSLTINWTPSTDDVGVHKYDIYINGLKSYVTDAPPFTAYNLEKGKSYNFLVKARDFANNISPFSNQATGQPLLTGLNYKFYTTSEAWSMLPDFNTLTPDAVGVMPNVSITNRSQNDEIAYLWEGFINIPVAGNYVFRTTSDDGSKLYLGPLNGTTSPYSHTATAIVDNDGLHGSQSRNSATLSLAVGTYPIAITFFEGIGGEAMSITWRTPSSPTTYVTIPNSVFADAPVVNGQAPVKPAFLRASPVSYKRIDLTWADNSDNETGFEIYRSTNALTGYNTVGIAPADATSYQDTVALSGNTTYYYKIRSIGLYGESGFTTYSGVTDANWKFNNNLIDASGNNRGLTNSNNPPFDPDAADKMEGSHALSLNGTNQHINFTTAAGDYIRGGFTQKTVAFWMKSTINTGNRIIVDLGGSDNGLALRLDANTLYAGIAGASTRRNFGVPYSSTGWNHIALVYEVNALRLYVNGVLAGSNTSLGFNALGTTSNGSRIASVDGNNAFNITIGARFSGWIDNFAIFNVALSPTDINELRTNHQIYQSHATTLSSPAVPAIPANLVANGISTSEVSLSWNDVATETQYEVYRSSNTNENYVLLATLPANTTTYQDPGLFANSIFYYMVRASNVGGNSGYSVEDSAITRNNEPVVTAIPVQYMRYGTQVQLNIQALDADPEVLTIQTSNLPSFASFTPTGNGTGILTLNPANSSDQGTYNDISIQVTDQHSGVHTITFNLVVNDNYVPELSAVTKVVLNENQTGVLNISASDENPADALTWTITGLPAFATPTIDGRNVVINFTPGYADHGNYVVQLRVEDGNNGFDTTSFVLSITDVSPNKKIYVSFTDGTIQAPAPWNNTNKFPVINDNFTNLVDDRGANSGIGIQIMSAWQANGANTLGVNTGNNSGVYPDAVIRTAYFSSTTQTLRIHGLQGTSKYNFTFFGSRTGVTDNRTTIYTINGNSVSLNAASNSQNTVTLSNLQPLADGSLTLTVARDPGSAFSYLNAMVIESIYDDGSLPARARDLKGVVVNDKIKLTWIDAAYNETAYEVYRSTTEAGPFTLMNPGGNNAGLQLYDDADVLPSTTYYYYVTAINAVGSSLSEVVAVTIGNTSPVIAPIASIAMETTDVLDLPISATDEPTDIITLQVSGLPSFATFTDNGNGTGSIHFEPGATTGTFTGITVTATDNKGASTSRQFNLTVTIKGLITINVNFNQVNPVGHPWNSFNSFPNAGVSLANLRATDGTVTTATITLLDAWENTNTGGAVTGNNSGVFPDNVMSTTYYFSASIPKNVRISGLSPAKKYNLTFFGSRGGVSDNRTTIYGASGKTGSLNAAGNTTNTVKITDLVPNSLGNIDFTVSKGSGASYAYLNAMVIESYVEGSGASQGINLKASGSSKSTIDLNWSTDITGATGVEVYRSTSRNGTFSLINTLAGNATSYSDQSLPVNTQYFYKVRTVSSGVFSEYSNTASAATLAYLVHVNFNQDMPAAAPWNNTNGLPQDGNLYPNLKNELMNPTNVNMTVIGNVFNGVNNLGVNTGTNSGVFPDNVIRSTWWLDGGNTAQLKIYGLNKALEYNFVFFASRDGGGAFADRTTLYSIGSKSASLNAINNSTQTAKITGITSDDDGAVIIRIQAGGASPYAYIGALVLQAYIKDTSESEILSSGMVQSNDSQEVLAIGSVEDQQKEKVEEKINFTAYPNPFVDDITLSVLVEKPVAKLSVRITDISGKVVYSKELRNINAGISQHKLGTSGYKWPDGVYFVQIVGLPENKQRTIKVIKR